MCPSIRMCVYIYIYMYMYISIGISPYPNTNTHTHTLQAKSAFSMTTHSWANSSSQVKILESHIYTKAILDNHYKAVFPEFI